MHLSIVLKGIWHEDAATPKSTPNSDWFAKHMMLLDLSQIGKILNSSILFVPSSSPRNRSHSWRWFLDGNSDQLPTDPELNSTHIAVNGRLVWVPRSLEFCSFAVPSHDIKFAKFLLIKGRVLVSDTKWIAWNSPSHCTAMLLAYIVYSGCWANNCYISSLEFIHHHPNSLTDRTIINIIK